MGTKHLCHIYSLLSTKLNWKTPLLATCKIPGLFLSTLAAEEKYSLLNKDNLTQPIQLQFSKKQKNNSEFFSAFFKSRSNFKHLEKYDDNHILCISEITDCERRGLIYV